MTCVQDVKDELAKCSDTGKAEFLPKFFQAYPGGYGEGDRFIGVAVPHQRRVARKYYKDFSPDEVATLLQEPIHEYRLTALFILVLKYEKAAGEAEKRAVVDVYLGNIAHVNNWDLVDASAPKILGPHFMTREKDLLYAFVRSGNLWKQRIAVMTTFHFIRQHRFDDILCMAEMLLRHEHDLMHKAVGWMLRETGKRNFNIEFDFLKRHYKEMPRTMLRYAIEKFDEDLRQKFLKGLV